RDGKVKKTTLVAAAALVAVSLAGCSTSPIFDQAAQVPEVSDSTTGQIEEPENEATEDTHESEPESLATTGFLTDEQIILEALMGPEGEYAAAASYLAVLEEFGQVEPYATIYEAEIRHADALVKQLERIGAEVPENPYIGQIAAPADLQAAAQAWAEGEVANIELYDKLLTLTDDPQLVKVLNNLRSASLDSHLPAFEEAAENGGVLEDMSIADHSASQKGRGQQGRDA
ncbi:MAG: hypothetical protein ACO38Q_07205, partial [Aquiluna sp.]